MRGSKKSPKTFRELELKGNGVALDFTMMESQVNGPAPGGEVPPP